jgi:hypothetical protein
MKKWRLHMTPAAIRRRLSRLEQALEEIESRSRSCVPIWDVICGAADWDHLDDSSKDAFRPLLEDTEPEECPIEKAIREVASRSTNGASSPETTDASNVQGSAA